jgi:hypothetical protein
MTALKDRNCQSQWCPFFIEVPQAILLIMATPSCVLYREFPLYNEVMTTTLLGIVVIVILQESGSTVGVIPPF